MPNPAIAVSASGLATLPADPTGPVGRATSPPTPGFAEVLRGVDPRLLPSVGLGQMLDHYAQTGSANASTIHTPPGNGPMGRTRSPSPSIDALGAPATGSASPLAASAPDPWGAAGSRPVSVVDRVGTTVLSAGERYLGIPYVWGGADPSTGFDCSGFVQQVYADLGVSLPRVSIDQSRQGAPVVGLEQARAGDLVFWRGSGSRPNHIGIYAGDGQMLVAPRTGDVVRYQQISRTPDAIRRIVT